MVEQICLVAGTIIQLLKKKQPVPFEATENESDDVSIEDLIIDSLTIGNPSNEQQIVVEQSLSSHLTSELEQLANSDLESLSPTVHIQSLPLRSDRHDGIN